MIRVCLLVAVLGSALCFSSCGGDDGDGSGDGGVACGEMSCSSAQLCVTTTVVSGTSRSTTLECQPKPAGCSPIACSCATDPICGSGCSCTRASETDLGCMCSGS